MAAQFSLEDLARIRDHARQLASHALVHEGAAHRALAAGEANPGLHDLDASRRLCLAAREQRVAADQLVAELGSSEQQPFGEPPFGLTVLIADDYEDTRLWLAVVLGNAGFAVYTASNGLEAVLAAYEFRPAVVLMDVMMPVLDGLEAARLIKEIDALRETRLIAYTAKTPPVSEGAPFAAVIRKPSPPDLVIETVKRCAAAAA